MRRKPNSLIPFEYDILGTIKMLQNQGFKKCYGWQIAKVMKDYNKTSLTGFGTLYRALDRLVKFGYLERQWEKMIPIDENRPRRRYYTLSPSVTVLV
jgi:DNA-binding PadR family transcriptional regulator